MTRQKDNELPLLRRRRLEGILHPMRVEDMLVAMAVSVHGASNNEATIPVAKSKFTRMSVQ